MVVKYIGEADMASKGINFITGYDYEVTDEVAKYLKDSFPTKFVFTETTKEKVVAKKADIGTEVKPSK